MATGVDEREGLGRQIERRSIDYVPEDERHGKVWHQGPFWFLGNDLQGIDVAWLIGLIVSGTTYYALSRSLNINAEMDKVQASEQQLEGE
jgi:hypothetical protein